MGPSVCQNPLSLSLSLSLFLSLSLSLSLSLWKGQKREKNRVIDIIFIEKLNAVLVVRKGAHGGGRICGSAKVSNTTFDTNKVGRGSTFSSSSICHCVGWSVCLFLLAFECANRHNGPCPQQEFHEYGLVLLSTSCDFFRDIQHTMKLWQKRHGQTDGRTLL